MDESIYGAKPLDEFLTYVPKMSLKEAGWLDNPAPMLLIGGTRDTEVPIEDVFLLMRSGPPRKPGSTRWAGIWGGTRRFQIRRYSRP